MVSGEPKLQRNTCKGFNRAELKKLVDLQLGNIINVDKISLWLDGFQNKSITCRLLYWELDWLQKWRLVVENGDYRLQVVFQNKHFENLADLQAPYWLVDK